MTKQKPIVSVILPTHNRQASIKAAVGSVLDQTYVKFELIIVDDGSTDGTAGVINAISDSRIRYLPLAKPRGAAATRNIGIDNAAGEWIAFQDSDDIWRPDKLAQQISALTLSGNQASVCFHGFLRKDAQRTVYIPKAGWHIQHGNQNYLKPLLCGSFIGTPTLTVRRELLKTIGGFDERLPRLQDWDLAIRLATRTDFIYIDKPLVDVTIRSDSITRQDQFLLDAFHQIIRKHWSIFITNPAQFQTILLKVMLFSIKTRQFRSFSNYLKTFTAVALKTPGCLPEATATIIQRGLNG